MLYQLSYSRRDNFRAKPQPPRLGAQTFAPSAGNSCQSCIMCRVPFADAAASNAGPRQTTPSRPSSQCACGLCWGTTRKERARAACGLVMDTEAVSLATEPMIATPEKEAPPILPVCRRMPPCGKTLSKLSGVNVWLLWRVRVRRDGLSEALSLERRKSARDALWLLSSVASDSRPLRVHDRQAIWKSVTNGGMSVVTNFLLVRTMSGVAQWLACWAHNPKVRGSKPRSAMSLFVFTATPRRDTTSVSRMWADKTLPHLQLDRSPRTLGDAYSRGGHLRRNRASQHPHGIQPRQDTSPFTH